MYLLQYYTSKVSDDEIKFIDDSECFYGSSLLTIRAKIRAMARAIIKEQDLYHLYEDCMSGFWIPTKSNMIDGVRKYHISNPNTGYAYVWLIKRIEYI